MLELDGCTLEGGGQLVRNALALSALTGRPVKINKIRGRRAGSQGLRGSHTAAVKFLLDVCGGTAIGAHIGSSQITFFPRGMEAEIEAQDYTARSGIDGMSETMGKLYLSPLGTDPPPVKPEYNIRQSTPGSIFLIFQALYPYLIYAGSVSTTDESTIKLNITGGTNLTCSPTYDYFSQTLIPNFAKLGLPEVSVRLNERGWSFGRVQIGSVSINIKPLPLEPKMDASPNQMRKAQSPQGLNMALHRFPTINLDRYDPGVIVAVDITVLAPDTPLSQLSAQSSGRRAGGRRRNKPKRRDKAGSDDLYRSCQTSGLAISDDDNNDDIPSATDPQVEGSTSTTSNLATLRGHIEHLALQSVRRAFKFMPQSQSHDLQDSKWEQTQSIPSQAAEELIRPAPQAKIHTTEPTNNLQHTYILLVAHTSTGFRLGRDAFYADTNGVSNGKRSDKKKKGGSSERHNKKDNANANEDDTFDRIRDMVDRCVSNLQSELDGLQPKNCVDIYLRDQLVVFQALGKLGEEVDREVDEGLQNNMDVSLHTRTAAWVCEKILDVRVS